MLSRAIGWILFLLILERAGRLADVEAAVVTALHTRHPSASGGFHAGAGMAEQSPLVFDNRQAQSFLATVSGLVQEVSFVAYQSTGTTAALRVDITSVVSGLPGASLAAASVPIAAFPESVSVPDLNVSADFSFTGLVLQAGTPYAIVFSSEVPNANYRLHGATSSHVPTSDPYPSGSKFSSQNGSPFEASPIKSDLYFQVTVDPVPEPAAVWLACCGLALLALNWRRFVLRRRGF
jgi:hypothetical protein